MAHAGNGRSEILRAARITFARHGFDGASIRDIAQEAGLSLSALYYYFPSKQDALYELIHNSFVWFSERALRVLEETGDDPVERLSALVRFTVLYRSRFTQVSRVILRDTERLSEDKFAEIRELQRETRNIYSRTVAAGIEAGVFSATSAETSSRAVLSIVNSIPLWFSKDGSLTPKDLEREYLIFSLRLLAYMPEEEELERLLALPIADFDEEEILRNAEGK
ncbi:MULTISPECIES: TetR/AcrR family transcriptional regulator [Brevibacterium]|uniref:TetR/AcrR family transcriptional regulator n=1 Tax=Brevibacterium salitolerans TaxID=1403566 RepID=A0ABN2WT81_9MICO|nr:TetR/AcrR family transcriptional regulator [Brevibacterium sp.]